MPYAKPVFCSSVGAQLFLVVHLLVSRVYVLPADDEGESLERQQLGRHLDFEPA